MTYRRYRRLDPEEHKRLSVVLVAEYSAGTSLRPLAAKHNLSYGRAYRILKEAGTDMRPRGGWNRKMPTQEGRE